MTPSAARAAPARGLHALPAGIEDDVRNLAVQGIAFRVQHGAAAPAGRRWRAAAGSCPGAHARRASRAARAGRPRCPRAARCRRLSGARIAPPPVASTTPSSAVSSSITAASRWRKPASPSISKMTGTLHAAAALDLLVRIEEPALQPPREQAPDGGLARPHHADEEHVARTLHAPIVRTARARKKNGRRDRRRQRQESWRLSAHREPFVDDARRDEHQQLGLVVGWCVVPEQHPRIGRSPNNGTCVTSVRSVCVVDAADHDRAAVLDQHLGLDVLGVDCTPAGVVGARRVLVARRAS